MSPLQKLAGECFCGQSFSRQTNFAANGEVKELDALSVLLAGIPSNARLTNALLCPGGLDVPLLCCRHCLLSDMLFTVTDLTSPASATVAAACSVAMKVFPSQNLALSKLTSAKAMGNGQYTFWMDGSPSGVPAAIDPDPEFFTTGLSGVNTLQGCLDQCTNRNLCLGARFGAYTLGSGAITASSCQLILAKVQVRGHTKQRCLNAEHLALAGQLSMPQ
jgi:hypothetical protein